MCGKWTTSNCLVYCKKSTIFIKFVDTTRERRYAQYLFGLMKELIGTVGAQHTVQVVTSNEAAFKATGNLMHQHYPHIVCCINLMPEEISKLSEVHSTIEAAKTITSFIYNYGISVTLLWKYTNNNELLRLNITRFATKFIALKSIACYKQNLIQLFSSNEWGESGYGDTQKYPLADDVVDTVFNQSFWRQLRKFVVFLSHSSRC